ncbi:MAG TPA: hypothetical protein DF296_01015 [Candidatus Margulisbacteria bacterium]|nr:MAG: hypothetical protein A2X41_01620 [Candidatus Margulisbacteria bacterium GWE2_39_32]HCT83762.1 hypothetical protein [Candidatus Margulisiibacteriota bacterium]
MISYITSKIPGKSVAKNSIINLSTKIALLFITLGYIAYTSRHLSQTDLGIFAAMFVFYSLLGLVGGLGLNTMALRLIPELQAKKEQGKISDIVKITVAISALATFIIALIGILFDYQISMIFLKSPVYSNYIDWIIINSFFYAIFDRMILIYQSFQSFTTMSVLNVITNISQRIIAAILMILGYGLQGIMVGFLIGTLLGLIWSIIDLRSYLFGKYNKYPAMDFIKVSFPYYGQGIMRFIFTQADQALIAFMFSPDKLAIYFIAKKIINLITLVFEALYDTVVPKLAEIKSRGIEVFRANLDKVSSILIFLVVIGISLVFLNSKLFMYLLGGEKFIEYYYLLNILALSIVSYMLYTVSITGVYLYNEPNDVFKLSFYVGITTVSLEIIFGMTFGLIGFSIAQTLGYLVGITVIRLKYKETSIEYAWNKDLLHVALISCGLILGYYINTYWFSIGFSILSCIKITLINFVMIILAIGFYLIKNKAFLLNIKKT